MPSRAFVAFYRALNDVNNLMVFHENEGGNQPGRRPERLQSLNKSAIVLLCAAWESYIEAIICECTDANVDAATKPTDMLKPLRKLVSSHIREGKDESTWQLAAGDGWKALTKDVVKAKVGQLNTPKKGPVSELMHTILGTSEIENDWTWHRNPAGEPARKLNEFVSLRGGIAHGEQMGYAITKAHVTRAKDLLERLVKKVEDRLTADGLLV